MDHYVTPTVKDKATSLECRSNSVKSEENAQKVNNFRQNNNAPPNQTSFIPVYSKKTDMCHNISTNTKDDKSRCSPVKSAELVRPLHSFHSPPLRQKCLADQNEKAPGKTWSMHMRRRSVGFEDVTSLTSSYGYSLSNGRRIQMEAMNHNAATGSVLGNQLNSENEKNFFFGKRRDSENGRISATNQNTQPTGNENELRANKSSQQLKDKSSKRKSSLNRMDFIDFPSTYAGSNQHRRVSYEHKNSSSDEGSDTKSQLPKSEFLSSSSKRKNNLRSTQSPFMDTDRKLNEVPLQACSAAVTKSRMNPLPRTLHGPRVKSGSHRRIRSIASQLQKLSHSAGELESLTDFAEATCACNKSCLSAQEFDPRESPSRSSKSNAAYTTKMYPNISPAKSPSRSFESLRNNMENASHSKNTELQATNGKSDSCSSETAISSQKVLLKNDSLSNTEFSPFKEISSHCELLARENSILSSLDLNGTLDLKHIDSRSEDESEVIKTTLDIANLDISSEKDFDNEIYISAEENCDLLGLEAERRPSSILRRKFFEEKKLHGILKPPPDDKQSKTPPSILKHRESSEEKDVWQQGDLHSILKKSTSEDESCNSGPDIRPILKVSTDEESQGGGSAMPRPILKKRTSFSEECSFASYPNGELRPILKKKTPLSSEDQPRPILKSRRKSEDVRSTMSEFIASRPRAYSADMGMKPNHETRFDALELNKDDLSKPDCHDL